MRKYILSIIFFSFLFSTCLQAKSGFIFGGAAGFMGRTKSENFSIKFDNGTNVSGTNTSNLDFDNELGFKFQLGLNYEFNEKLGMLAMLGYFDHTTKKEDGKRAQIEALDFTFLIQMHVFEDLFARVGLNIPFQGTYNLNMDNKSQEAVQGGALAASGVIGYEAHISYRLMDNFMVSLGYAITSKTIKVEREDGNSDEYTIEFDSNSSHVMIGFDYVMPIGALN